MQRSVRISRHDLVHEVEELDAPVAAPMRSRQLAGGDLEGGEQCGGTVPLVIVTAACQRSAIGKLEPALHPFQGLDRALFVNADHDRVLGRGDVKPDHIGGLDDEVGICAFAPGLEAGEVDLLLAHKMPDLLLVHVPKSQC
jgi:hypothetical protein